MASHVTAGESVLDVGCNSGYIVEFLPPGCRAYGVDVAAELVVAAGRRLLEAKVAPAEALPYEDKSVDVVLLGEILEHVHDAGVVLREAARVARRLVAGSTPHELGKWGPRGERAPARHRFHVRCFDERSLRETLEANGLGRVRIDVVADGAKQPQMYVFAGYL